MFGYTIVVTFRNLTCRFCPITHQVIVWDMNEMCTVRVLQGFHRRAVTLVTFSPNGRLLATLGADDHHGLAVYDWKNSVILCATRWDLRMEKISCRRVRLIGWCVFATHIVSAPSRWTVVFRSAGSDLGLRCMVVAMHSDPGGEGVVKARIACYTAVYYCVIHQFTIEHAFPWRLGRAGGGWVFVHCWPYDLSVDI